METPHDHRLDLCLLHLPHLIPFKTGVNHFQLSEDTCQILEFKNIPSSIQTVGLLNNGAKPASSLILLETLLESHNLLLQAL